MTMRSCICLLFAWALVPVLASAQDLTITYNFLTGKSAFTRTDAGDTGKAVTDGDVYVGYGDRITVQVVNMNPGIYVLEAHANQLPFAIPNSTADPAKALTDAIAATGSTGSSPGGAAATPPAAASRTMVVAGVSTKNQKALADAVSAELSEIAVKDQDARVAFLNSADKFTTTVATEFAPLASLRAALETVSDSRICTCSQISTAADARVAAVIGLARSNVPSDSEIIAFARKALDRIETTYVAASSAYAELLTTQTAAAKELAARTAANGTLLVSQKETAAAGTLVSEELDWKPLAEARWKQVQALEDSIQKYWMPFSLGIAGVLGEIHGMICERSFDITALNDAVEVQVTVKDLGTRAERERAGGFQTRSMDLQTHTIPVAGGLKFNGSVGFGPFWFPGNQRRYFVDSGTIRATAPAGGSLYTMTMAHGYYRARGWAALGATFGVGVDMGDPHHIAVFAGPSVILGKEQRMVATLGIAYGQVTALADEHGVGETFANTSGELLTATRWAWGIGLGVSYNIFSTGK